MDIHPGQKQALKSPKKREFKIYMALGLYMAHRWPQVMYRFDYAAGMALPAKDAALNKRIQAQGLAWPDLFIAHPAGGYHGLFLELKASRADVFRKDGSLRKVDHVTEQGAVLARLEKLGFRAVFACGTDEAIQIIEQYLKQNQDDKNTRNARGGCA